jgi:hypothetical protein
MIKKSFLLLFTGFSMLALAQETPDAEPSSRKKERAEKPAKEVKAPKPEKPAKEVSEQTSAFKPEAGDISVDFTGNDIFKIMNRGQDEFSFSDEAQGFGGGIRLRYFTNPGFAFRLNFSTELTSLSEFPIAKDPLDGLDKQDGARGSHEQTIQFYSVSLGGEKHFDGTERLDTYLGAELMFSYTSKEERFNNIDENGNYVEGYRVATTGGFFNQETINISDRSAIRQAPGIGLGARVFTGADFYVFPKVYLGVELGVACTQKWIEDYRLNKVDPSTGTNSMRTVGDRGDIFNISQDINGQFRLGFRF